MSTRTLCSSVLALALALTASSASAGPPAPTPVYLLNPSFDIPETDITPGESADTPAMCVGATGRPSASMYWSTWVNTPLTQVTSWLIDSPDHLYTANLVFAGAGGDGLVSVLSRSSKYWLQTYDDTLTNVNSVGVWVWVVAGQVGVQLGNGGNAGGGLHMSETNGVWEYIGGCGRADGLNNEITIYANGPAIYYVDDASVEYDAACAGKG
jgi:hypothetical protein